MKRFAAAILVLFVLSGCGSPQAAAVAPTVIPPTVVPATAAPTQTPSPKPTSTVTPTKTPAPTKTPTATPLPTETPTATPEPFKDIIVHGSGQRVLDKIMLPAGWYTMTFLHAGQRGNTVVQSYSPTGEEDLLVNVIGCCGGTYLLDSPGGEWQFSIEAVGKWDVAIGTIRESESNYDLLSMVTSGDSVSKLFTSPGGRESYIFTHEGDGNFTVWLTCDDGSRQLLQNEIGIVANQKIVTIPKGKCAWEIRGDGSSFITETQEFQEQICTIGPDLRDFLRQICNSLK